MRWKAFHTTPADKKTFGFKSKNCPPSVEEMRTFEERMINIMKNIAYKDVRCQFQQDLKKDMSSIKNEERLFVKADKSANFYKLDAPEYNRLLNDNITKTYKKAEKKMMKPGASPGHSTLTTELNLLLPMMHLSH